MIAAEAGETVKIFFCYARRDKALRDKLEDHLEPLRRSGQIITWHDREILPGMEWKQEIDKHLNTSDVVLLLVSPNFMRSDYCYSVEMKRALEMHKSGMTRVIPIILRSVDWKETPISELQVLPTGGKPIANWRSRDEAFEDVVRGIRRVLGMLLSRRDTARYHDEGIASIEPDLRAFKERLLTSGLSTPAGVERLDNSLALIQAAGILLKRFRRAAGLSLEELASLAGYSASYISKIERGERMPNPTTVEFLARCLSLSEQEHDLLAEAVQLARKVGYFSL